jgi:hypothetical protein
LLAVHHGWGVSVFKFGGIYQPGSGTAYFKSDLSRRTPPPTVTQDNVEFFTNINIEAGQGKYNWLHGLVCIGELICDKDEIIVGVYTLTNFPSKRQKVLVRKRKKNLSNCAPVLLFVST